MRDEPAGPSGGRLQRDVQGAWVDRTSIRVRYAEIDRMGFAYNAHYLTWFEIGRTEFMRAMGLPYREIEERGTNLPLVEVALRLRQPVRYDDLLTVETQVADVRSRRVGFAYRLLRGDALLAEGTTSHACVQAATGKAVSLPVWLAERLTAPVR